MKLEVVSLDKNKKKLEVLLSGLKEGKTHTYKFDTDVVNFGELWKLVNDDLKAKQVVTKNLSEIAFDPHDKTEKPDTNAVDLEALEREARVTLPK